MSPGFFFLLRQQTPFGPKETLWNKKSGISWISAFRSHRNETISKLILDRWKILHISKSIFPRLVSLRFENDLSLIRASTGIV